MHKEVYPKICKEKTVLEINI